ncbi:hypothetical protein [Komagataeibacter medellinensis]|uniref:Uncharacterized protein n=1 Tax=Komagataeibacter medellinensis (strain NBRC 3288 / BCRC 11682 / LMG 1693 / Kondo 51) TaxID=634177 RepID=G2I763_KOMMN|nr:hypothetical protein [Komagataeibacter medellinensis]BAK83960.1 hypothetical protein GLX_15480 [Komagataeibacter medellinensis NBRC 3288]
MNFRRATTIAQKAADPGEVVRLVRWWRGYQKGQVARFDTITATQLKAKGWAIPYKPTKDEKEDDERRVQIQMDGIMQDRRLRASVIQGLAEPTSPKRARA